MASENPSARVALVTGGASGIGAASCRAFARRGHSIAIVYRSRADEAEGVAAECRALGAQAIVVPGDVGVDADCRSMVASTISAFGRLDVVVNAAGQTQFVPMGDLEGVSAEDFTRVIRINAIGPFQVVRAAAPHLRAASGAVVNVSSVASIVGNGSSMPYVASKAALNALTLALARNLGPEIRVNAVLPGLVHTDWVRRGVDDAYDGVAEQWSSMAALQRCATAEEVAEHIAFLAADANLMTGQLVVIDNGYLLGRPASVSK